MLYVGDLNKSEGCFDDSINFKKNILFIGLIFLLFL